MKDKYRRHIIIYKKIDRRYLWGRTYLIVIYLFVKNKSLFARWKIFFRISFFSAINASGRDKANGKDIYLSVSICKHAIVRASMSYIYRSRRYRVLFTRDAQHGRPDGDYLSTSAAWNFACNDIIIIRVTINYYLTSIHIYVVVRMSYIAIINAERNFLNRTAITTLKYFSVFLN